jgi:hypothetical protein
MQLANILPAVFGLVGVILGGLLTVARDWWFQWRRERKDVQYLVVQVVGHLDRFVAGCARVAADSGEPDAQGYSKCQVQAPKFEPQLLNVEWRTLPLGLMAEVLDLPYKIELAEHAVDGAFEYSASPPDFEEGFEERQQQYARLGVAAAKLAKDLRYHVNLSARAPESWDPVMFMTEELIKGDMRREALAVARKKMMVELG